MKKTIAIVLTFILSSFTFLTCTSAATKDINACDALADDIKLIEQNVNDWLYGREGTLTGRESVLTMLSDQNSDEDNSKIIEVANELDAIIKKEEVNVKRFNSMKSAENLSEDKCEDISDSLYQNHLEFKKSLGEFKNLKKEIENKKHLKNYSNYSYALFY